MCRNQITCILRWLLPGCFLFSFSTDQASAVPPYNTWLRFTADYNFNPHWRAAVEFQHRRQSSYENGDPFRYPQLYSVRPWLYYRLTGGVRLEGSPMAFYTAYRPIQQAGDKGLPPGEEWRTSLGISAEHKLGGQWVLHTRGLWELRYWFSSRELIRMRTSIGLSYEMGAGFKAAIREELLVNLSGTEAGRMFDQERRSIALSKQCCTRLELEAGYLYLSRWQAPDAPLRKEQDWYVNLTYHLR